MQIFLAGLGVFHLHAYGLDARPATRPSTRTARSGSPWAGIAVLILVLALVARPGGRAIAWAVVLVRADRCSCRACWPGSATTAAVWGGLHALDGLLAIAVAGYLYGVALA